MSNLNELIARARSGEIMQLTGPHVFTPLVSLLTDVLDSITGGDGNFLRNFGSWSQEDFTSYLGQFVQAMDDSGAHYRAFARAAADENLDPREYLLFLTLEKSLRICVPGVGKRNYGYFVHRDSWFDLAPDGVNINLYLSDVSHAGNTVFFPEYFGKDLEYDPETRHLSKPIGSSRTLSFNCTAGDCLMFAGEQLHGGGIIEVPRLSVEFRVSRMPDFGRPQQGIDYRRLNDFLTPDGLAWNRLCGVRSAVSK